MRVLLGICLVGSLCQHRDDALGEAMDRIPYLTTYIIAIKVIHSPFHHCYLSAQEHMSIIDP